MTLRRQSISAALVLAGFAVLVGSCNNASGNVTAEDDNAAATSSLPGAATNGSVSAGVNAQDTDVPVNALEGDALVPGTGFNATAQISCVTRAGRASRDCSAGVVRNRDGTAIVTIFWPEGRSRAIFFDASHRAFGADTSEADGTADQPFHATRHGDDIVVTIGPERYVVPDELVVGG